MISSNLLKLVHTLERVLTLLTLRKLILPAAKMTWFYQRCSELRHAGWNPAPGGWAWHFCICSHIHACHYQAEQVNGIHAVQKTMLTLKFRYLSYINLKCFLSFNWLYWLGLTAIAGFCTLRSYKGIRNKLSQSGATSSLENTKNASFKILKPCITF